MSVLLRMMAIVGVLLSAGCAAVPMRQPVPAKLALAAELPGMPGVRVWGDGGADLAQIFTAPERAALIARRRARAAKSGQPVSNLLALSGGADDGAFGAGFLVGWTRHGSRSEFDLVTGISAGALLAPFAFLGPEYDVKLKATIHSLGGEQLFSANILSGLLGGPALADSAPFAALLERYIDRDMIRRIASERRKGRILAVGTTNLDAQRPVFWDMGRIAQSRHPRAPELFRKVPLASASVPGIFPPVHIEVAAGGRTYKELHVDGGPTRQVFFTPVEFSFGALDHAIGRRVERRFWVIRNGNVRPDYAAVPETAAAIATRSLETLTKSQGIGDLIRMYDKARAEGIEFNLAAIPADFAAPRPKPFDTGYMSALYDRGLALGIAGYRWARQPPDVPAAATGR
jgi:predicted acylesterase/phospholipase RssA